MSEHSSKHTFVSHEKVTHRCAHVDEDDGTFCWCLLENPIHAQAEPKPVEIAEKYDFREHPLLPGSWEITITAPNGDVYLVLFGGANAKARAQEYLTWKGGWIQ